MTLIEQLRDIATKWFNPHFAKRNIPEIANALAVEAFRSYPDSAYAVEHRIIRKALTLIDDSALSLDIPGEPHYKG